MRTLVLLPVLALLAACGDCDCPKHKTEQPGTTSAATSPAPAPEPAPAPDADAPRTPPTVTAAWRGEGTTLELSVWEMRCGGCEKKVEDTLAALDGVSAVTASAKDSRVVLTLAKAESREALKAQIRSALAHHDFKIVGE
jgi:copper chaperone CopZ